MKQKVKEINEAIVESLPLIKKMSKRAASVYLFENYPNILKNTEAWRDAIRTRTGNHANQASSLIIKDTFNMLPEERQEVPEEPFVIPTGVDKMLVISDLHSLFCNKAAVELAIKEGLNEKCDAVLINGDLIDFYSVSDFCTDPSIGHFKEEQEWGRMFLSMLQQLFGVVYYKAGNHELRLRRYLMRNAAKIYSEDLLTLQDVFSYDNSTVNYIHDAQLVSFGKLAIIHGHEIRRGGQINISRNKFLGAYSNILFGHHHRVNEDYVKDVFGHYFGSWSIGCLCRLKVGYDPFNQWMNGFAIVTRVGVNGNFAVNNFKIINDKIIR